MKKILLMGLGPIATEDGVRSWLSGYGSVTGVELIREGDAKAPVALVHMDITEAEACFIVSRISNYWHDGSLVSARLLNH